ncbi:hypothetical protein GCM10023238_37740 [Streptomyces heliomycini]
MEGYIRTPNAQKGHLGRHSCTAKGQADSRKVAELGKGLLSARLNGGPEHTAVPETAAAHQPRRPGTRAGAGRLPRTARRNRRSPSRDRAMMRG